MFEKLKLSPGEVTRISLNRPERKNALDLQLLGEIDEAVQIVKKSEARVLILSGEGDTFCSGLDLDTLAELSNMGEDKLLEFIVQIQRTIYELRNLPIPVVAACKRYAIGGGMQIALAADIRLATPKTMFFLREMEFGIIPDMGVLYILPRLVGDSIAREMILAGGRVSAEEGKKIGLVNEIYKDLEKGIKKYVGRILKFSRTTLKESKRLIESGWNTDFQKSLDEAKESQLRCIRELKQMKNPG